MPLTNTSLAWVSSSGNGSVLGTCQNNEYPNRIAMPIFIHPLESAGSFQYVRSIRDWTIPVSAWPACSARSRMVEAWETRWGCRSGRKKRAEEARTVEKRMEEVERR